MLWRLSGLHAIVASGARRRPRQGSGIGMSWTDERIEKLTKMWEGGATASQIAEELGGVSRNAVIGKAHRLGLKARPSPVKPTKSRKAGSPPRQAPKAAEPAKPRPVRRRSGRRCAPLLPRSARAGSGVRCGGVLPSPAPRPAAAHRLGRSRRLPASGPRRSAGPDPARAAAPPGAGQAQPGNRRQDQPARSQRPHLPLADGPSGRAGLSLLRREGEPRLPLLRRALRPGLSGAAAARPSPPPPPLPFGGPRVR
jgi:GcrA cell cycle regulator